MSAGPRAASGRDPLLGSASPQPSLDEAAGGKAELRCNPKVQTLRPPVTALASARPHRHKPTSPLFQVPTPRRPDGQPRPQPLSLHRGQKPGGSRVLDSGAPRGLLRCSVSPGCMRSPPGRQGSQHQRLRGSPGTPLLTRSQAAPAVRTPKQHQGWQAHSWEASCPSRW